MAYRDINIDVDASGRGATGPTGPIGPEGEQGEQGDQGPQGIQGVPGAKGDTGNTGATGATGPQGPVGPQGVTGATGDKGDKGDPGLTGPQGIQGNQGVPGQTGPQGIQGVPGPTGADSTVPGPVGPVGATGPQGIQGIKGDTGSQGPIGPTGLTGPQGPKGDQGDVGPTGPVSTTPGPQGPVGPEGPIGPQGPQGLPGAGSTSDTAYGPAWNGVANVSPSQNAVYDKIESIIAGAGAVSDVAYGPAWDAVTTISPSKNAVYDKIELLAPKSYPVVGPQLTVQTNGDSKLVLDSTTAGGLGFCYINFAKQGLTNGQIEYNDLNNMEINNYVGAITVNGETGVDLQFNDITKLGVTSTYVATTVPFRVPDEAYGAGWNAKVEVPTKNAVYDKIEAVIASIPAAGLPNGDKGDVLVASAGASMTVQSAAGDFAAGGNVTATGKVSGALGLQSDNGYIYKAGGAAWFGTNLGTINFYPSTAGTFDFLDTGNLSQVNFNCNSKNYTFTGKVIANAAAHAVSIDAGTGYSTVAGANPKLLLYNPGYGFGVSDSQLDYMVPAAASHAFYVGTVRVARIASTGMEITGALAVSGIISSGGSNLATVGQLANYLPLSGGTIAGTLSFSQAGVAQGSINTAVDNWMHFNGNAFDWRPKNGVNAVLKFVPEGGNPLLQLDTTAIGGEGYIEVKGQNPRIKITGDVNSYYPGIVMSTLGGAITAGFTPYSGMIYDINTGQHQFRINSIPVATITAASLSIPGNIIADGTGHRFGPVSGAAADLGMSFYSTNFYQFWTWYHQSGGASPVSTGNAQFGAFGVNWSMASHNFYSNTGVHYASIGVNGVDIKGKGAYWATLVLDPEVTNSNIQMKGAGGVLADGLNITAGAGNAVFQANTHYFRSAANVDYTTINTNGLTVAGRVSATLGLAVTGNAGFPGGAVGAAYLYHAVDFGAVLYGEGTLYDLHLANKNGSAVLTVATGTQIANFSVAPTVGGSALATVSQLANYLPLSGGIVAGLLTTQSGQLNNGAYMSRFESGGTAPPGSTGLGLELCGNNGASSCQINAFNRSSVTAAPLTFVAASATFNCAIAASNIGTASGKNMHVGTTAPASPATNDLWVDTN